MINHLCDVLDRSNEDRAKRLKAYKLAARFRAIEEDQGIFSILFRNAAYGYYYYEHNSGFTAVLDKAHIYKAYRDLDPVDLNPYILYSPTEEQLLAKIMQVRQQARPEALLHNFDYFNVHLHSAPNPMMRLPHLQLWLLSQKEAVIRLVKRVMFRIAAGRRNVSLVLSLFR
jgi:hypothetical protein